MMQSLLPALYPMLRGSYRLSFTQIGLLTFTFQFTASLLQPLVGLFADRSPRPYSLAAGMGFTLAGLLLLAFADSYALLLVAAALIGTGSSVFHPESSRVARMASGGKHGLAQSVFQVGGNLGTSAGPLLGFRRAAARAVERRVVLARRAAGHRAAHQRWALVQDARRHAPGARGGITGIARTARSRRPRDHGAAGAGVLEVCLPREPH